VFFRVGGGGGVDLFSFPSFGSKELG